MPPAVGVAIAGIAGGVATVAGSKMQANASRRAGDIQASAADKALAYEREREAIRDARIGRHEADYAGWRGGPEVAKLSDLLGLARGQSPAPPVSSTQPAPMPRQTSTINQLRASGSTPTAGPSGGIGRMVRIQSPMGDVREVPAHRADYYVRKGGRLV